MVLMVMHIYLFSWRLFPIPSVNLLSICAVQGDMWRYDTPDLLSRGPSEEGI